MALTDAQVDQFSRQILLRPVGGRGQEALLAAGVRVVGEGALFDDAAAYLAGSGVAVERMERPAGPCFGLPPGPIQARTALLGPVGTPFEGAGTWCAVGQDGGDLLLVWRTPGGCCECFEQTLVGIQGPDGPGASPLLSGALAALAVQACVLGMTEPVSARRLRTDGTLQDQPMTRCARCAPGSTPP